MAELFLFQEHYDAKEELAILYGVMKSDRSPEEKKRVREDMIAVGKRYGFSFGEYMIYGFEHKTPEEQHAFLSDKEHFPITQRLNTPETEALMDSKIETYRRYRKYYKRELCLVTPEDDGGFCAFAEKNPHLFIKPNDDWGGANARRADLENYPGAAALLKELLEQYPNGFLAEERMVNAGPFLTLHPGSLNTVRMPTILLPDGPRVIHPFARIGCGDAVVDNAAAGGIMGCVDVDTGVIYAARDKADRPFDTHPDTGVPIVGFRIPEWEAAKAMACEMAKEIEDLRYCGWDMAYTERGWVMIEGNAHGQFVWQMVDKTGSRAEFENYLDLLGK